MRERNRQHNGQQQRRQCDQPGHREEEQQVHRDERQHRQPRRAPEGSAAAEAAEQVTAEEHFFGDATLGKSPGSSHSQAGRNSGLSPAAMANAGMIRSSATQTAADVASPRMVGAPRPTARAARANGCPKKARSTASVAVTTSNPTISPACPRSLLSARADQWKSAKTAARPASSRRHCDAVSIELTGTR